MRLRRWIPPVVWMALIYVGSTASFSAEATGPVILPVLGALLPWADPAQLDFLHAALRKAAHVAEYGILAWLWLRALAAAPTARAGGPGGRHTLAALAISIAYATLDELHQRWTGARAGSLLDVFWDAAGASLGVAVIRFGWQTVVGGLTTTLFWIAAAGGTLLLLLHLLTGTPGRWLWLSAPLAWIALWAWRRRRRPAP
ncbi:MAG: VanZ family protein [Candidatus Rokubacteria bacterium]|nr:VanZ family protein [Candidatus Rokubacteria bacterium]